MRDPNAKTLVNTELIKDMQERYASKQHSDEMRERSGTVQSDSKLVSFFYTLLRDHLPPGIVEEILRDSQACGTTTYTNGWLAEYAKDIVNRLK